MFENPLQMTKNDENNHHKRENYNLFDTNQNNIVVPTKELIGEKGADFRVILAISTMSNVKDHTKKGDNYRYLPVQKLDRYIDSASELIGISTRQFRAKLKRILEMNSSEFCLKGITFGSVEIPCIVIDYSGGGFVNIEYSIAEEMLVNGASSTTIKMFTSLLWLCMPTGKKVAQETLLNIIGLSKESKRSAITSVNWLKSKKLIETKKIRERDYSENPLKPRVRDAIYYSIVC